MSETILGKWIAEAKAEIKENRTSIHSIEDDFHSFKEDDHAKLRLDFENFRTEIRTKNRIIWVLVTTIIAASGTVITLLTLLHKATEHIP